MSETKDNHFVPRFYLKNFTSDPSLENGSFDFFNLKTRQHVGDVPHGSQMKEKYFYAKESEIETELSEKFEGKHADLVKKYLRESERPDEDLLLDVILLMNFRTRAQRDDVSASSKHMIDMLMDSQVESFKRSLAKDMPWLSDRLPDDEIRDMVRNKMYEYLNKQDLARKQIDLFKKTREEIRGLRCIVLNNPSSQSLISSDRPVILINPFLQGKRIDFGKTGMFQMGIVLILPISPTKLIVSYDSSIYEPLRTLNSQDVKNLNRLQVLSGVEGIYSARLERTFVDLIPEYLKDKKELRIRTVELPGDYILTYKEDVLPNLPLSFLIEKEGVNQLPLRFPFKRLTQPWRRSGT